MKEIRFIILLLIVIPGCSSYERPESTATNIDHSIFNKLLSKHVSKQGKVNYVNLQKERKELKRYLKVISTNAPDPKTWSKEKQMAYWINAYNAFTLELILENYPLESITDLHPSIYIPGINTVWHKKFFKIGGKKTSLDEIEHKILRTAFDDPRIHFAINCASFSCPKLRNEVYTEKKLIAQLEEQAKSFINNSHKNVIRKGEIRLSKIFKWFKADFIRNGNTLIDFLNLYSNYKIPANADIKYMEYNWALNE